MEIHFLRYDKTSIWKLSQTKHKTIQSAAMIVAGKRSLAQVAQATITGALMLGEQNIDE